MEQKKRNAKKEISNLRKSLEGVESDISLRQTMIRGAQRDIELARMKNDTAAIAKYEQELKEFQEQLRQDEKYKAEWEREVERLERVLRD